ncbi:hypothetical protein AFCA_004380 [Aspergillus flavus]|nr:hypothetical protein AFCA_004380 [Aspergillus flavus]
MDRTTFPENGNMPRPRPVVQPFAGRIGGNQGLVVDRTDPDNADLLKKVPDAAPLMTFREGFDLRGFWDIDLWKYHDDGVRDFLDRSTTSFGCDKRQCYFIIRRILNLNISGTTVRRD